MNDNNRNFRKYQNNLMVAGQGIVALACWSMVKFFIYIVLKPEYFKNFLDEASDEKSELVIFYVVVFLIMLIILLLDLYIGKSAAKEANGICAGRKYLVISTIIIIFSLADIIMSLTDEKYIKSIELTSIIVDLISDYFLAMIVVCGIKLKKYKAACTD